MRFSALFLSIGLLVLCAGAASSGPFDPPRPLVNPDFVLGRATSLIYSSGDVLDPGAAENLRSRIYSAIVSRRITEASAEEFELNRQVGSFAEILIKVHRSSGTKLITPAEYEAATKQACQLCPNWLFNCDCP
jgi:hypothetical protein